MYSPPRPKQSLTLHDGTVVWLNTKLYSTEEKRGKTVENWGLDFTGVDECPDCDGHPSERGNSENGWVDVDYMLFGLKYTEAAACPKCVFGAFRNQLQKCGWPERVLAMRAGQERERLEMRKKDPAPEVAPEPEAVSRVGDLISGLSDGLGF